MEANNIEDSYSLSLMQQGMLFNYLSDKHSGDYIQQCIFDLQEEIDIDSFKDALERLYGRHQVLRSSFQWQFTETPIQVVNRDFELPFLFKDLSGVPKEQQENNIDDYLKKDRYQGFDLSTVPLNRFSLFRLGYNSYKFVWSYHHIILDGTSRILLFKELFKLYDAVRRGRQLELDSPPPYKDYINWIGKQVYNTEEMYWKKLLKGFDSPTPLSNLKLRGDNKEEIQGHGEVKFNLTLNDTALLRDLAAKSNATLSSVIMTAWAVLLSQYSGEKDVVFGTVRNGRNISIDRINDMVGLLINTLPIRTLLSEEGELTSLIADMRTQQLEQKEYEHVPLNKVQEWSDVSPDELLFESYIVYNYRGTNSILEAEGIWQNRDFELVEQSNYPLVIMAFGEPELLISMSYAQNSFDQETIKRMAGQLQTLLVRFANNHDGKLSEFEILTDAEKTLLIEGFNKTAADYPKDVCLHTLFENQVDQTPNEIALSYQEEDLTYHELDQKANQLGHHLRNMGIEPESLVGVFMERSFEMVIALYGILKAGGGYVPLDPEYPTDRLVFMIEDTQIPVILTQEHLASDLPETNAKIICLDSDWNIVSENSTERLENKTNEKNLAYVIFTSGSTGKPKGVMNEHRGICNRLFWMQDAYQLGKEDRVLQKTPYSFDVSVWEFFWPLLFGARLVISPPGAHKDPGALVDLITGNDITTIHFVPSMLQLFLENNDVGKCKSLIRVICSGEALGYDLQERFFKRIDNAELHNLYGPTEAAVDVTYWECNRDDDLNTVPIGYPVANTQIYIVDTKMRPVPIGVPGELHIGGIQVARGYINRPELTKERFIPDPFSQDPEGQLYKTGDLCRYFPSGAIEYLGRMDFQVKIRGLRIELGEIESIISQHENIREAVVTALKDDSGSPRLVGYIVPSQGEAPSIETLRTFLEKKLPDYMVPELFVTLDAFPLTSSGKTDRKALPKPDTSRPELEQNFVPPSTETERKLADIWCGILNIDKVGIYDKFFSLGGNSLRIIQTVARIQQELNFEVPAAKMLQYPTISQLAKFIEGGKTGDQDSYSKLKNRAKLRKAAVAKRKRPKRV